jgi:DNA-binding MurR/RpiR family transcriptional regulator
MPKLQATDHPQDINQLKGLVARRVVNLSDQQELVARALFANPEMIAFGSASSIATACNVSPSTVVRVAKAFGFEAFRDFREVFRRELRSTGR